MHTREGHRSDLADLSAAKAARGRFPIGIGDCGPMRRILVRGEAGHDIISKLYPIFGKPVIDKPGKGAFYATDLDAMLKNRGITQLLVCGAQPKCAFIPQFAKPTTAVSIVWSSEIAPAHTFRSFMRWVCA